jgi:hypothetical protein
MKLTAKGYAKMSSIINPDIAVLEGGYAIQGALPFTNMAIIMSMAGLDWTKVNEPAPRYGFPKTSAETLDYVKKLAENIHKRRLNPVPRQSGSALRNGWWERERRIFSDTHPVSKEYAGHWPSYINENRFEALRDCQDCPGVLKIKTGSEVWKGGQFVRLPHNPCEKCRSVANDYNNGVYN